MPWSSAVAVDCVSALRLRSTASVSPATSVHADQRPELLAAEATRPAGVPLSLANTNCPSQPPPLFGPQSMAASVYVSTTCSRPRTNHGAAPGTKPLAGEPP